MNRVRTACLAIVAACLTTRAAAQVNLPPGFNGPPLPVAPASFTRDDEGRVTMRAVRLTSPIRLDGRLDEEIYSQVPPVGGMIQIEPQAGSLATEQTDVWVTFDDRNVYVTVRCWDSHPERMVLNEMRRDNPALYRNDHIDVVLDTFYDRRNAFYFSVTALGARVDAQLTNERQFNTDFNPVWDVEVGRFEGGWTAEMAIPFKTLRYRPGRTQIWSFNIQRENWWKNEISVLTRMPAALGARGIFQISLAPTLVGVEVPPGSKNLDIKPYVVSDLTSDLTTDPKVSNDLSGNVGVDVRYGLSQNLTADFTYNTDFAQVEADEQQINLTRFSLFFPEKREFFLENQGTFSFGGILTSGTNAGASDAPILFYSRRIGLNDGRITPIHGGGRLTGRVGRFSLGVLDLQTDDEPVTGTGATNFSVVRLKRDVLRRSSIGVMYTGRSLGQAGGPRNDAYGVDGTFAFFNNLSFNTHWARTRSPGRTGDDASYRVQMDYAGDRYGAQVEDLVVGANFRPEVGFVRRYDMHKRFGLFRFSPRPRQNRFVRKLLWTGNAAYIENTGGRLETRTWEGHFAVEFHSGDRFEAIYTDAYEFLPQPFRIATGVTLPVGGYDFSSLHVTHNFGAQRRLSGNVSVEYGNFYNGRKTTIGVSRGRTNLSPKFSLEPSFSVNRVDLVQGSFTTTLVGPRVTYTMTPRMFVSALVQYNSGTSSLAANVRLRWEYQPGSELFVVFNEQRDTLSPRFPTLSNRAVILKINRLFRL